MAHATSRFGHYDITTLVDGVFEAPTDVLIHAGGDAARRQLIEAWGDKGIRIDVNVFALRGSNGVTLIDAGVGPTWGAQFGKLREAMPAAGILPEQIERVLLTHIHGDHALGLLDGPAPWLPRAELLVPAADLAFFTDPAARAARRVRDRREPRHRLCGPAADHFTGPRAGDARRGGHCAARAHAGSNGLPSARGRGEPDDLGGRPASSGCAGG